MEILEPNDQKPNLRGAAAYVLAMLQGRLGEAATDEHVADIALWLERSFEADPLGKVRLGLVEPNSLVVVWPAEKCEEQQTIALRDHLREALGGKFVGAVFADPDMRLEQLDDAKLAHIGLVRKEVMEDALRDARFVTRATRQRKQ